jgi:hypothetical protein
MEENIKKNIYISGLCNKCPNLTRRSSYTQQGQERDNVYCDHFQTTRLIEFSMSTNQDIKFPDWCPIKKEMEIKEKMKNGIKLTDGEKRALMMERKPLVAWDDIETNVLYHIPPLLGEPRKDILVTYKGQYSCSYKNLSSKAKYPSIETFYPSSLMTKFLFKNKLSVVKQIKN